MSRYVLTPAAREDLVDIWSYVAQDSPAVANRVVRRIRETLRLLSENPKIGHPRSDLADEELRVWPVFSYLVVFRPETRPLQVIRIVSGRRDLSLLSF